MATGSINYKGIVPDYLQDRPRSVILHCLDRQATSMKFKEEDVEDVDANNGMFNVISKKERNVDFGHSSPDSMPSCSCPDWDKFHLPCKHFFAIILFRLRPAWIWNRLPRIYLESAYLSLDNHALRNYYQEPQAVCPKTGSDYTVGDDFTVSP